MANFISGNQPFCGCFPTGRTRAGQLYPPHHFLMIVHEEGIGKPELLVFKDGFSSGNGSVVGKVGALHVELSTGIYVVPKCRQRLFDTGKISHCIAPD
jgi:hypothetical protein